MVCPIGHARQAVLGSGSKDYRQAPTWRINLRRLCVDNRDMRIVFDRLGESRRFPLNQKEVKVLLGEAAKEVPELGSLRLLRVGWNGTTTQEASIIRRGRSLEIRINFSIEGDTSRVLSRKPRWLRAVRACGGVPDLIDGQIQWPESSAKSYFAFLLLHEVAHLVADRRDTGVRRERGRAQAEENFCDEWALRAVDRLGPVVWGA